MGKTREGLVSTFQLFQLDKKTAVLEMVIKRPSDVLYLLYSKECILQPSRCRDEAHNSLLNRTGLIK